MIKHSIGYKGTFFDALPRRMEENTVSSVDPLTLIRTDYSDVEEIVDDRYFVPSSASVSGRSRSYQGLYDSSEVLKDSTASRLNARLRHPSTDVTEASSTVAQLKRLTIEYLDNDVKEANKKKQLQVDTSSSASSISQPPQSPQKE